jgi:hypothetical protein
MSSYAPSWALGAQATDAAGDPHLAKGVHLRLFPGPVLGLPIFPFRVFRVNLGQPGSSALFRSDGLRFVDSKNQVLVPPFTMSADNPVTVFLPPPADGLCCWIEILAEATASALRCEAQVAGDNGLVTLASATTARYQMAAARIDRVRLTGAARIAGGRWIDARQLDRYTNADPWRLWSLPTAASTLYTPTASAAADAGARVQRGGPLREPMFKAPGAASPAAAPAIPNPAQAEKLRVDAAAPPVQGWLATLVGPGSDPPALRTRSSMTGGNKPVQLQMSLHDAVWLSAMDPGLSRWLGFGDVDDMPQGQAGDVVAYIVKGLWQQGLGRLDDAALQALLAPGRLDSLAALNSAKGLGLANPSGAQPPFYDLFTVACATLGQAGPAPAAPVISGFESKPFLPLPPPAARREIVVKLQGMAPGPGLALARQQGGVWTSLNPKVKGVPVALLVGRPLDAVEPGSGRVSDRQAPAEAVPYRAAQADWFGRWSPWAAKTADAGQRPRPPQPVLQVGYQPPKPETWTGNGPLAGVFTVVVPVPPNDALAPGSMPLTSLKLKVGATSVNALPSSANLKGDLVLTVPGPALLPCASAQVTVTACWIAGPQSSDDALPVTRTIHDPRAPAPVQLGAALDYASRPDAGGKSRVDLRWQAGAGQQRFRVYYASETVLVSRLKAKDANLAGQITGALTLPLKAQAFRDLKKHFDRSWFELLTADPLEATADGQQAVVHEVSGKLATLGLYRVASVSAANVEGSFAETPLVAYAVPNVAPPTQPLLEAKADPQTLAASLRLRVPRSAVPAAKYRLRRSTGAGTDVARMRVVQQGAVPAAGAADTMQTLNLADPGLKPWKRYVWRVEVRGADLPGSTIAGAWSRPSAAVEAVVIPATAPLPVQQLSLKLEGESVRVVFKHDRAALAGGALGRFRIDLYRRAPGDTERGVATLWADAPEVLGGFDAQGHASLLDSAAPLPGTVYRVLVTDPLGRCSASNPTITVPQGS